MIKLIVYDLDGTLIDSAIIILDLLNFMRKSLNKNSLTKDEILPLLSIGGEKMIAAALGVNELEVPLYLEKFRNEYFTIPTPQDSLYPGVRSVLIDLSIKYRLAICTNKPRRLTEKVLIETNLREFFTFIIAGDDLISKKPHPQNLRACINHFGLKPQELILVGDSTVDLELALSCDVKFVHFLPGYNDGVNKNQCFSQINNHIDLIMLLKEL